MGACFSSEADTIHINNPTGGTDLVIHRHRTRFLRVPLTASDSSRLQHALRNGKHTYIQVKVQIAHGKLSGIYMAAHQRMPSAYGSTSTQAAGKRTIWPVEMVANKLIPTHTLNPTQQAVPLSHQPITISDDQDAITLRIFHSNSYRSYTPCTYDLVLVTPPTQPARLLVSATVEVEVIDDTATFDQQEADIASDAATTKYDREKFVYGDQAAADGDQRQMVTRDNAMLLNSSGKRKSTSTVKPAVHFEPTTQQYNNTIDPNLPLPEQLSQSLHEQQKLRNVVKQLTLRMEEKRAMVLQRDERIGVLEQQLQGMSTQQFNTSAMQHNAALPPRSNFNQTAPSSSLLPPSHHKQPPRPTTAFNTASEEVPQDLRSVHGTVLSYDMSDWQSRPQTAASAAPAQSQQQPTNSWQPMPTNAAPTKPQTSSATAAAPAAHAPTHTSPSVPIRSMSSTTHPPAPAADQWQHKAPAAHSQTHNDPLNTTQAFTVMTSDIKSTGGASSSAKQHTADTHVQHVPPPAPGQSATPAMPPKHQSKLDNDSSAMPIFSMPQMPPQPAHAKDVGSGNERRGSRKLVEPISNTNHQQQPYKHHGGEMVNIGTASVDKTATSHLHTAPQPAFGGDDADKKQHKQPAHAVIGGDTTDAKSHKPPAHSTIGGDTTDSKPHGHSAAKPVIGGDAADNQPHRSPPPPMFGGDDADIKIHKQSKFGGDTADKQQHHKQDTITHAEVGGDTADKQPHHKQLTHAEAAAPKRHDDNQADGKPAKSLKNDTTKPASTAKRAKTARARPSVTTPEGAATRIQAVVRGRAARKKVAVTKGTAKPSTTSASKPPVKESGKENAAPRSNQPAALQPLKPPAGKLSSPLPALKANTKLAPLSKPAPLGKLPMPAAIDEDIDDADLDGIDDL